MAKNGDVLPVHNAMDFRDGAGKENVKQLTNNFLLIRC